MEKDHSRISDSELESRLKLSVKKEREDLADLLKLLSEFESRQLHAKRSFSTLFDYCVRELGYSEGAAIRRVFASRTARKHPLVARRLRQGKISLSTVYMLTPHICQENCASLLHQTAGKSKRDVERIVASFKDGTAALPREIIRPLGPVARQPQRPPDENSLTLPLNTAFANHGDPQAESSHLNEPQEPTQPIKHYTKVTFVVEDEFLERVERLKVVMRGKLPNNSLAGVFAAGVTALMEKHDPGRRIERRKARARTAAKTQPKSKPITADQENADRNRHIPEAIKNEVWTRDGGRCAYHSADGRRCTATKRLEYDHIRPWALGGRSDSSAGIRLLCKPHNQLEARRILGDRVVDQALAAISKYDP